MINAMNEPNTTSTNNKKISRTPPAYASNSGYHSKNTIAADNAATPAKASRCQPKA